MLRFVAFSLSCVAVLSAQPKKIVVMSSDNALMRGLQEAGKGARIVPVTMATASSEIGDADAFIGMINSEQVRAGKNLKWVGVGSAGVEDVLYPPDGGSDLRNSNIMLTNNKIVQGPEIADHALAMLLMLSRNLYALYRNDQQEVWNPRTFHGIELSGKTAVVVGVGGIGTQIAIRAHAFGMTVIGVDPEDKPFLPFVSRVVKTGSAR